MVNLEIILITFVQIFTFFLVLLVFLNAPKKKTHQVFACLTLSGIFWTLCVSLADFLKNPQSVMFWTKMAIVGPTWVGFFFYYLSLVFPQENQKVHFLKLIPVFVPALILSLLTPTNLNVKEIKIKEWGTDFVPGSLYYFLFLYLIFCFISSLQNFKSKYQKLRKSVLGVQILYLLWGFALALIIGIVTNLILPISGITKLSKYGPSLSVLVFASFVSYAMIAKQLFDIKLVLIEISIGIIAIVLIIQIIISEATWMKMLSGGGFLLFSIFGYVLIKSVWKEIKLRETAERISQAKSEFISIASHQLRTPLSAIKGYLSMILEGSYGELPEKVRKPMENVYQSNERLIKLVNDILSVSKIEAGEMEMNWEREDLREIIKEVISELSIKAKEKNLYLKFEEPKEFPKILLDREKIRQVILNLVDNAIRYTQKGGVTVKLQIANGKLQIVVSDTGEGLTKEEKEKLFERFSRGTAGTKFWTEGAGLGLYVARRFVEMHKGKIWAESEGRGKGSTFYIELPIR